MSLFCPFVATAEQDNHGVALLNVVNAVPGPVVDPQFADAFANRFHIAQLPSSRRRMRAVIRATAFASLSARSQLAKVSVWRTSNMCILIHSATALVNYNTQQTQGA